MTGEGKFFETLGDGISTKIPGGLVSDGIIKTTDPDKTRKYMRLDFDSHPIFMTNNGDFAAPTGANGDENIMMFPEGTLEYHVIGTNTILGPTFGTLGLEAILDAADDEGMETCGGILASNKLIFTVGTDAAFFVKMKFNIATVAGTDYCVLGFRKMEAYQAAVDDYDEMAGLNVNAGNILYQNILNGGATVATDTTDNWADAATHELEVRISAAGVASYRIDGLSPTVAAAAFTFDDGEVVTPFFYCLNNSTTTATLTMIEFECGLQ